MKRKYSAREKLAILEEAAQPDVTLAEVCRRHGIASSLYYKWQKQAKEGALSQLSGQPGRGRRSESEQERMREELRRKDSVIAELTARLIEEKKRF